MARDLLSLPRLLADPGLGAVQLRRSDCHDRGASGWTLRQNRHVTSYGVDSDASSNIGEGLGDRVHPGCAIQIVVHRSVRDDLLLLPTNLRVTNLRRLDAEPFGRLRGQYHTIETLPEMLEPGRWTAFRTFWRLSARHKL